MEDTLYYLTEKLDEIVIENYRLSTQQKYFNKREFKDYSHLHPTEEEVQNYINSL